MNSRELVRAIVARKDVPRPGFWLGNPHPDTLPLYHSYFGTKTLEELHHLLGSDFRWLTPQYMETTYRHPEGKGIFDIWKFKKSLGEAGPFAECDDAAEVERYEWPELRYLDFSECLDVLKQSGDVYRASGFWTPFFHDVMDLFGVEQYMVKMLTAPGVVHAVTDRVCSFYYEANERFFDAAGSLVDAYFFGNDFGSQRDLLLAPGPFDEFVLPWFRRLTEQAHRRGYQVVLHSCGSIARVIDRLIEAGVDCLHPLQAKAEGMDAQSLSQKFGGRISFLGGIDTQEVLVHVTVDEVRSEVRRVKQLLGPHVIISPSHEALLPNVPPRNVQAMAEEALRLP